MINRVIKKSVFLSLTVCLIIFFYGYGKTAFGVLTGSTAALISYLSLYWALNLFINEKGALFIMLIISSIRLLIIFSCTCILVYFKLLTIGGLFIGFTLIYIIIIYEGIVEKKYNSPNDVILNV
ncbi:MAG: hypothetical protein L3V56_01615 [Candidatus Magnetoovum sp. WYHC-5]|nr:hypothetical protein [Candidatus Magnetoovum sp. WYHC-5]